MAQDKKTDELLAAEKAAADEAAAAADKAALDKLAAEKAAAPKKPEWVVAEGVSTFTATGHVDAGGEVKATDFHSDKAKSKAAFDELRERGVIVKGG